MIDLTNCEKLPNTYRGSEKKKRIIYNGEIYLVKFPDPIREKGNTLSYMNNQYSEYLGCHILDSLGIKVQETFLAKYTENSKEKIVVACKDMTSENIELIEISALANSITSSDEKYTTNIEDVYEIISKIEGIRNKDEILNNFWNLFVADALIGNPDRHLDNWGLLYNRISKEYEFSPVYDCGSCLNALLSDNEKKQCLSDINSMKNVAYNLASVYYYKGKRVFYLEIFKNPPTALKKAIKRIVPRIDLDKINSIIDNTPSLTELDKHFFKEAIKIRKEMILDRSYSKIIKEERQQENNKDSFDDDDVTVEFEKMILYITRNEQDSAKVDYFINDRESGCMTDCGSWFDDCNFTADLKEAVKSIIKDKNITEQILSVNEGDRFEEITGTLPVRQSGGQSM